MFVIYDVGGEAIFKTHDETEARHYLARWAHAAFITEEKTTTRYVAFKQGHAPTDEVAPEEIDEDDIPY